jgi:hypothetical protein
MTPARLALTIGTLVFGIGVSLLMLRGWRARQRRQADLPPLYAPADPDADELDAAVPGLYVGTTFADDWLDRVAVHRLAERATAWFGLRADGVLIEREGLDELYLPWSAVRSAQPGDALAGKVVGAGGLLLVDWVLGDRLLTTGFRADDHAEHRRLAAAVTAHLPVQEAS